MTNHDNFWVAVATVAPVIGLAHAVGLGRNSAAVRIFLIEQTRRSQRLERKASIQFGPPALADEVQAARQALMELRAVTAALGLQSRMARTTDLLAGMSFIICTLVLSDAMFSLADGRDVISPRFDVWGLLIASLSLATTAFAAARRDWQLARLSMTVDD